MWKRDEKIKPTVPYHSLSICNGKINLVCVLIEEDWWLSAETKANITDISIDSACTIVTEKSKWSKLSVWWVPKCVQPEQLQAIAEFSVEILKQVGSTFWSIYSKNCNIGNLALPARSQRWESEKWIASSESDPFKGK